MGFKKAFSGGKKTAKPVKKEKDIMKMSKEELAVKAKELDQKRDEKKLSRVEDVVPESEAAKGCFVRNVMHKGKVFKAGEKLAAKHPDFAILKKHIA